ncbi:hypothetical protein [Streptomyces microflavus]|uniref:hypothetical protein n=1 Tax=Streptomyces microflavus TaxID=1919 RepID=UPI0036507A00
MTEQRAISARRSNTISEIRTARQAGRHHVVKRLEDELREMHVALGERRAGTKSEQTTYLLARSSSTSLPELLAVGIDSNLWPPPPSTSSRPAPLPASPDTERRITDLFAATGQLPDRLPRNSRYVARHRPQDGQRYHEKPLNWAIWDTETNQPVAWHADKELAEYQADLASERFGEGGLP